MPLSPEQRKAASERMKAMHAKRKAEKEQTEQTFSLEGQEEINPEPVERPDAPTEQPEQPQINTPSSNNDDYRELLERIRELEARQFVQPRVESQPTVGAHGMIGTYTKFNTDPAAYPDETKRLAGESKLSRFAFPLNYELEYSVGISSYTTIDNIRMKEPKFTLKLIRKILDEETGEPTNKRFVVCSMVFHEDPETALIVAHDNGVEVNELNEALFLNEMRYLRMRDWLLECFYPPKPAEMTNKKTMVIGNRQVDVYEINGEQTKSIPFNQLSNKF